MRFVEGNDKRHLHFTETSPWECHLPLSMDEHAGILLLQIILPQTMGVWIDASMAPMPRFFPPFTQRAVAQLGRALRSGRRGRGFESRRPENV